MQPRLIERYRNEVVPKLSEEFGYANPHEVPKLTKIVVNMGVGDAVSRAALLEGAVSDLETITGQHPAITRAKKSIAGFKLREGNAIGAKVTLRGARMYEFLDRLIAVVLPRIRDFRGVGDRLDGHGNFSLGLQEQTLFPEIDLDKVEFQQGMNVTIVTTARTDEEGRALLEGFGMPFRRHDQAN